jgi:hypothetical protein
VLQALPQLTGSFVCECNRQNVPRAYACHLNQVGDAVGYRARFSRAGAREDQEWTVPVKDCFLLGIVEPI